MVKFVSEKIVLTANRSGLGLADWGAVRKMRSISDQESRDGEEAKVYVAS